jgi:hypothetical protein
MALTASANPSSATTPTSFTVTASGGVPPYSLTMDPSPPNPSPAPAVVLTQDASDGSLWTVEVQDSLPRGTVLYFTVRDANGATVGVTFTSRG